MYEDLVPVLHTSEFWYQFFTCDFWYQVFTYDNLIPTFHWCEDWYRFFTRVSFDTIFYIRWFDTNFLVQSLLPRDTFLRTYFPHMMIWQQFFTDVRIWYQFFIRVSFDTNFSHVMIWYEVFTYDDLIPNFHGCEDLVPILHIVFKALLLYGPRPEKTCLRGWRTTKAQTSLFIRAVWSAPLLFAYWKVSYKNFLQAKILRASRGYCPRPPPPPPHEAKSKSCFLLVSSY